MLLCCGTSILTLQIVSKYKNWWLMYISATTWLWSSYWKRVLNTPSLIACLTIKVKSYSSSKASFCRKLKFLWMSDKHELQKTWRHGDTWRHFYKPQKKQMKKKKKVEYILKSRDALSSTNRLITMLKVTRLINMVNIYNCALLFITAHGLHLLCPGASVLNCRGREKYVEWLR